MSKKFLLTAISKDRPGIVADISQVIYENGCNLEKSSMMYLAGEFAMLLLLSAPERNGDDSQEMLSKECRRLEREKSITAFIRVLDPEEHKQKPESLTKTIRVEGLDQAGIVYKVSQFLADNGINIRTMNTETILSPQSGITMYNMTIVVEIPTKLSLPTVEDGLVQIGDQLNVDVSLD